MNGHLVGQETELAIRFEPRDGRSHPGNKLIFEYLAIAIRSIVKTQPGKRSFIQDQFFTENGGAIYYEHHPQSLRKGLIEFATPECSSAHELVLYQRAQESLLLQALPMAEKLLTNEGFAGSLRLIKNSRDYLGNTYGTQENYDGEIAHGWRYYGLLAGLLIYLPLSILTKIIYVLLLIPFVFVIFMLKAVFEMFVLLGNSFIGYKILGGVHYLRRQLKGIINWSFPGQGDDRDTEEFLLRVEYSLFYPLFWLSYKPLILLYNAFAFRRQQKALESFLVTRMVFTGVGSLIAEDDFRLSEKSSAITSRRRRSIHRLDKPLFDCGNLIKEYELAVWELFLLRVAPLRNLFKRRQRLQVAFSDSNRCQFAEFLKIGTGSLLLKLADQGLIRNPPLLAHARVALARLSRDTDLTDPLPLQDGASWTALEIQKWYLHQAERIVADQEEQNLEDREILRLWRETLERLEHNPASLFGRLDWLTKRQLLAQAGAGLEFDARKKIDIKYHELGTGYFDDLERQGLTLKLFAESEIDEAVFQPSSPRRVKLRSRLIKNVDAQTQPVTVSWSQGKVGRWRPKVISFDDYRSGPASDNDP
jgi:proteasome accessory factor A